MNAPLLARWITVFKMVDFLELYIQGVSWELTKSISFVLYPGGIPGTKLGDKQFFLIPSPGTLNICPCILQDDRKIKNIFFWNLLNLNFNKPHLLESLSWIFMNLSRQVFFIWLISFHLVKYQENRCDAKKWEQKSKKVREAFQTKKRGNLRNGPKWSWPPPPPLP